MEQLCLVFAPANTCKKKHAQDINPQECDFRFDLDFDIYHISAPVWFIYG